MAKRRRRNPLDIAQVQSSPLTLPEMPSIGSVSPLQPVSPITQPDAADGDYGGYGGDYGPAMPQPLTNEEEQSLLGSIAGGAEYIGDSLEKPGYAVRGLLTGKGPESLLNLIPFYDAAQQSGVGQSIGLPEAPKVSGWDLAEHYGAEPNQPGFDLADIPKAGLELATNPLSFVSFGPKLGVQAAAKAAAEASKGLSTAEKIWAATKAIGKPVTETAALKAKQFRSGERAVAGFGLPFMEPMAAIKGGKAGELAASIQEAIGYSRPMAAVRGLFSHVPGVGGNFSPSLQRSADMALMAAESSRSAMLDAVPAYTEGMAAFQGLLDDAAKELGKQGDVESMARLRDLPRVWKSDLGGIPGPQDMADQIGEVLGVARGQALPDALNTLTSNGDHFQAMFDGMQKVEDTLHAELMAAGGKIGTIGDDLERYTPRVWNDVLRMSKAKARGISVSDVPDVGYDPSKSRRGWLGLIPRSTKVGNELARDGTLTGRIVSDAGEVIQLSAKEHSQALSDALNAIGISPGGMTRYELQKLYAKHKYLLPELDSIEDQTVRQSWMDKLFGVTVNETTGPGASEVVRGVERAPLPSEVAQNTVGAIPGVVNPESAAKIGRVTKGSVEATGLDRIVKGLNKLPKETVTTGVWDKTVLQEHLSYVKSMTERLYNIKTMTNLLAQPGILGAEDGVSLSTVLKRMKLTDEAAVNVLKAAKIDVPEGENIAKIASQQMVSTDGVRILDTYRQLQKPAVVSDIGRMWDTAQGYFKTYLTVPWPSFHVRNVQSGLYQNIADSMASPVLIAKKTKDAIWQALTGNTRLKYFDEFKSLGGVADDLVSDVSGVTGVASGGAQSLFYGIRNPIKSGLFSPLAVGANGGKQNIVARVGSKMYGKVELINRASYYDALRETGYGPSEALHYVNRANFDYAKASPFERTVMKRMFPFWSWTRNNLPLQLKRVIERPVGGVTGATLQATRNASGGEGEFVPEFLREGLGIRLKGDNPNETTFLKQVGIPTEELNKVVFRDGMPNIPRTLQKNLAGMSPMAVAPIESATGRSLWTGRKLTDLQSTTGIPMLDSILHYSPASRFETERASMMDKRKSVLQRAANYLSGVKVGTYNADIMKDRALKESQQRLLAENPDVLEGSFYSAKRDVTDPARARKAKDDIKTLAKISRSLSSRYKAEHAAGK